MTRQATDEGQGRSEVSTGHFRAGSTRAARRRIGWLAGALAVLTTLMMLGPGALAATAAPGGPTPPVAPTTGALLPPMITAPTAPAAPLAPVVPTTGGGAGITLNIGNEPSQSLTVLLLITLLAVAPSLLLLLTSFTKIFVVLSLSRNALGLSTVPPNQVLAGLALFLSMFVMGPVLSKVYDAGIAPFLDGSKDRTHAWRDGIAPLRQFMLAHTRPQEIALMLRRTRRTTPRWS